MKEEIIVLQRTRCEQGEQRKRAADRNEARDHDGAHALSSQSLPADR
jgi:hypothetical protein